MSEFSARALADLFSPVSGRIPWTRGGVAAAICGALGASVLTTGLRAPNSRSETSGDAARITLAVSALSALGRRLLVLANEDRDAHANVAAARRLTRRTVEQRDSRSQSLQAAIVAATNVSLQIMEACGQALHVAMSLANCVHATASDEVAVGVELLIAAFRGAGACVTTNLSGVSDPEFVARVMDDCRQLEASAAHDREIVSLLLAGDNLPVA